MASKFQFYEVVRVNSVRSQSEPVLGREGAVIGKAENEDGSWGYTVWIYEYSECWYFSEEELESTGRMEKRETFHDGTRLTVQVDPLTGEGKITGYNEPRHGS